MSECPRCGRDGIKVRDRTVPYPRAQDVDATVHDPSDVDARWYHFDYEPR